MGNAWWFIVMLWVVRWLYFKETAKREKTCGLLQLFEIITSGAIFGPATPLFATWLFKWCDCHVEMAFEEIDAPLLLVCSLARLCFRGPLGLGLFCGHISRKHQIFGWKIDSTSTPLLFQGFPHHLCLSNVYCYEFPLCPMMPLYASNCYDFLYSLSLS